MDIERISDSGPRALFETLADEGAAFLSAQWLVRLRPFEVELGWGGRDGNPPALWA